MIKLCSELFLIFPLLKSAPTLTFVSLRNKASLSTQLPKQPQKDLFMAFLPTSTYGTQCNLDGAPSSQYP